MSTTSPVRPPGSQPLRPPAEQPAPSNRLKELLAAVGSLLALVALLVGLPAALATLVGWPLPSRVPTGSELLDAVKSPITDQMLINALACVFWVAWVQILACTVVEVRAAVKGVGVPRRLPLAGVTQNLTRKLVATVLLLVTTTAVLTPVTAAVTRAVLPEASTTTSISASAVVQDRTAAGSAVVVAPDQAVVVKDEGPASAEDRARLAGELAGRKVLVVEPPAGRHHMSLWEVAERHLGDGLRYKEIFALNEGRDQPAGASLAKARLIQPGWQLLMPDDATGVPVVEAPVTPAQTPVPVKGAGGAAGEVTAVAQQPAAESAVEQVVDQMAEESPLVSALALAEAGLLSVGLLAGIGQLRRVQQRRRRDGERLPLPPEELLRAEVAARLGEDVESAYALDNALRLLSMQQGTGAARLPDVVAAVIDPQMLRLVLAEPTRPVPAPFTAADPLGGSWQAPRSALPEERPYALSPYPSLVTVGSDDAGGRLLIDLEAVGVLGLSGPRHGTTAVLRAMAVELATSGWADYLRLTLVGFGEELRALQPERVHYVPTLSKALPALERRLTALTALADGPEGVLRSRTDGGDPLLPELVLIAEQRRPSAEVLERLRAVAAGLERRCGLALVTSEDVPEARWTLRVAADGSAVVQPLGAGLVSRGLDDEAWAAVTQLVAVACAPAGPAADVEPVDAMADAAEVARDESVAGTARLPSLADIASGAVAGAAGPAAPLRLVPDDADPQTDPPGAAGEVRILGPVDVHVPGVGPAPHPHCVELAVLLALHPAGLLLPAIAAALSRQDEPAEAVRAAQLLVVRTRSWLGTDAAGRELLPAVLAGQPLRLSPELTLDWDRFGRLAARPSTVGRAFALVRGPVLSALPPRRYTWLVPTGLEQDVASAVVDAAARSSASLLSAGDAAGAVEAAAAGLRADRLDERLWRDLLRAEAALGNLDRVAQLVDELAELVDRELFPYDDLQPETVVLVDSLLPREPQRVAR